MANPHANLTVFSCPQLAPASPDVVRSFFRRFHTLERVTLRENFSTGNEIHTLPGTSSLAIMVGLNSLPALRELSLCVDANGITQTLLLLNTLRTLNSLAQHVEESQTNEESNANEESIVEGLQALCCCSPTLLDLSVFVSFDLTVMEFVPSLQHLDLTRVRIPAPTRGETGACAVRNRSLWTLSLTKCRLGGNDYSFVYHLEGLAKLELNEMISETSNASWGDLLRRMPSLRALRIESWLGVNDGAVLSGIAESIHDNSTFESLELKWRTAPTSLLLNTSMGPLMHRLRHTLCLDRMRWSVSNVTFISNALACRSDLQHLYLRAAAGSSTLSEAEAPAALSCIQALQHRVDREQQRDAGCDARELMVGVRLTVDDGAGRSSTGTTTTPHPGKTTLQDAVVDVPTRPPPRVRLDR